MTKGKDHDQDHTETETADAGGEIRTGHRPGAVAPGGDHGERTRSQDTANRDAGKSAAASGSQDHGRGPRSEPDGMVGEVEKVRDDPVYYPDLAAVSRWLWQQLKDDLPTGRERREYNPGNGGPELKAAWERIRYPNGREGYEHAWDVMQHFFEKKRGLILEETMPLLGPDHGQLCIRVQRKPPPPTPEQREAQAAVLKRFLEDL